MYGRGCCEAVAWRLNRRLYVRISAYQSMERVSSPERSEFHGVSSCSWLYESGAKASAEAGEVICSIYIAQPISARGLGTGPTLSREVHIAEELVASKSWAGGRNLCTLSTLLSDAVTGRRWWKKQRTNPKHQGASSAESLQEQASLYLWYNDPFCSSIRPACFILRHLSRIRLVSGLWLRCRGLVVPAPSD